MRKRYILFIILLTFTVASWAQDVFVSSSGNDGNSGLSWNDAKKTIPAALAMVVDSTGSGSGNIFVKVGNYSTTSELIIPAGVTLRGGYRTDSEGTDTTLRRMPGVNSNWTNASYCTIISGAGTHRIARVSGLLEACVIRNGFTETIGGGLLLDGGTARFCVVKECDAIDDMEGTAQGGGVYVRNNAYLLNCVITGNRADDGAAVAGNASTLINNTITNNHPLGCGLVQDYDGNVYQTVVLGEQCWMRENLRTTHFTNGVEIAATTNDTSIVTPYRYNGYTSILNADIFMKYGYLYNYPAVKGIQTVATSDSTIPSFNIPSSGSSDMTVSIINIYDVGGPDGNYSNNCNGYVVLRASTPGRKLSVKGSFTTESYDYVYLYNGEGTSDLIGSFSGTGTIDEVASSGVVTIKFTSDGSSARAGFNLTVAEIVGGGQLCPVGWHVPSNNEWNQMFNYVGGDPRFICDNNSSKITKALASKTGWSGYSSQCCTGNNTQTNNATRFNAYPVGYFGYDVYNYRYYGIQTRFWTTTRYNSSNYYFRYISYDGNTVGDSYSNNYFAYSVRCLKDD